MEHTLSELDRLQALISFEKRMYKKAILNHKTLGEVKVIYRIIKDIEQRSDVLMKIAEIKLTE